MLIQDKPPSTSTDYDDHFTKDVTPHLDLVSQYQNTTVPCAAGKSETPSNKNKIRQKQQSHSLIQYMQCQSFQFYK